MTHSSITEQLKASILEVTESTEIPIGQPRRATADTPLRPAVRRRRNRLLASAAVLLVAGVGLLAWNHLGTSPDEPQQTSSPPVTTVAHRPPSGRSNGQVTSLETLVRSADAVADVTVSDELSSDRDVGPGEVETTRVLTLEVNDTIVGSKLPHIIRVLEDVTTSGPRTSEAAVDETPNVGDRVLVALVAQPNGVYEFNGNVAFFPLHDPAASKALATARLASVDPTSRLIGEATFGLSDAALIALVRSFG